MRNDNTTLNWECEDQIDFSHFEIERKTPNSNFTPIGTRVAINSSGRLSYSFIDNVSGANENAFFYRLKMVDIDGKYTYSKTILVRKQERYLTGISMSPNPVSNIGDATIRFNAITNSVVTLRILDMSGKIVHSQKRAVTAGINSVYIDRSPTLTPGTYTIQLINEDQMDALKFSIVY